MKLTFHPDPSKSLKALARAFGALALAAIVAGCGRGTQPSANAPASDALTALPDGAGERLDRMDPGLTLEPDVATAVAGWTGQDSLTLDASVNKPGRPETNPQPRPAPCLGYITVRSEVQPDELRPVQSRRPLDLIDDRPAVDGENRP